MAWSCAWSCPSLLARLLLCLTVAVVWRPALADPLADSDALRRRAEARLDLGRAAPALADLEQARRLAEAAGDGVRVAVLDGLIGRARLAVGAAGPAEAALADSLAAAAAADPRVAAPALNTLGNLRFTRREFEPALAAYRRSAELAARIPDPALEATAGINAARALAALDRFTEAEAALAAAAPALDRIADGRRQAFLRVGLAAVLMAIGERDARSGPDRLRRTYDELRRAADTAERAGDRTVRAHALDRLGQLYERAGRLDAAADLTDQALFLAQEAASPDLLFRGHWQAARLRQRRGDLDGAIRAYGRAVENLGRLRPDLSLTTGGFGSAFREAVGPVLQETTDLLLRRAARTGDPQAKQADLRAARDISERFKAAELEDYFQDDCIASLQAKVTGIDRLEPRTAALYPILLPDRVELLVSLSDGLHQVTVPVPAAEVAEAAHRLRPNLERRTARHFLADARRLYDWLVRPLDALLAARGVETLVLVPDGPLRGIPLAALHDGDRFVIETYAVAVAPGLSLLEPKPLAVRRGRLLLAGLTESVQGFPPLPYVADELTSIERLYGGAVLENERFREQAVRAELARVPYSVIHIASHGEFGREARDSFVLTFDGRLTMDELERSVKQSRFRDEPVELLTLSACQTAAGDDRAALGLAGVAIKAGARSALATLWSVNDQASQLLVAGFYRALADGSANKAAALRDAQLRLLKDPRYRHPGYWAPFQLIGNWL